MKGTTFLEVADNGGGNSDTCHQQPQDNQVVDILDLISHRGEPIDLGHKDSDAG